MAEDRKKASGVKLAKSEITTIRLDPKLKYLAELAARKQRRSLSSFIEWAIEDSLSRVALQEWDDGSSTSVAANASALWDIDEPDRVAQLALKFPDLLTHEEQVIWKLVRENGYLWRGSYSRTDKEWTWKIDLGSLLLERLRDKWDVFKAVAAGAAPASTLPTWNRMERPKEKSGFDEMDDDIPF